MPVSLTSVQKKALLATWNLAQQSPIQFAMVAAPDAVLWLYKRAQDAPSAVKVLEGLRRDASGFKGTTATIGRVELDGQELRILIDPRRTTGPKLSTDAFRKAWKAAAKLAGLDRAAQLIDKAEFGEAEEEVVEAGSEREAPASGEPRRPDTRPTEATPSDLPAAPSAVTLTRTKVLWTSARSTAAKEFEKLLRAIYTDPEVRGNPRMTKAAGALKKAGWKLDAFDDRINDALDAVAAAPDAKAQSAALAQCRSLLAAYRRALTTDPVLQEIDENPFVAVKVRASLETGIRGLEKVLDA